MLAAQEPGGAIELSLRAPELCRLRPVGKRTARSLPSIQAVPTAPLDKRAGVSTPNTLPKVLHKPDDKALEQTALEGTVSGREFRVARFRRSVQQKDLASAMQQVRSLADALRISETSTRPLSNSPIPSGQPAQTLRRKWGTEMALYFADVFQSSHTEFFQLCLRNGRLDFALEVAALFPPRPHLFTPLLKACLDYGSQYAVMRAVEVRTQAGVPEDAFCFSALLKAASQEGNNAKVDAIFESAWARGVHDPAIFNVIIGQHNAKHDPKAAFGVLEKMLSMGVEPDAVTFNLLIQAAGNAGRKNKVDELYSQMRRLGPQPTSHTFVHLFNAFKSCSSRDADWIFEMLTLQQLNPGIKRRTTRIAEARCIHCMDSYSRHIKVYGDMSSFSIQPITQHLVTFLVASSDAELTAKQIHRAVSEALSFCALNGGDCSVYAALLKFCMGQGIPEKAVDIWRAIRKGGHSLNSWVFTALFSACALNNCPEMRVVVKEASIAMDQHWLKLSAARTIPRETARGLNVSYNALLNACAKMGMMTAAKAVFQGMQKRGPTPDIITYNTLLSGYAQAADTEHAFAVFHELCEVSSAPNTRAFKLRPTLRTFGALLHACARSGNASSAKSVLGLMRFAGVNPSAEIYTSLMHACVRQGSMENVKYAFKIYDQMKAEQIQPTAVTYGCLINACEACGRADHAFDLYQEACHSNVMPTDECHNILINAFAKLGRLEEAVSLVKEIACGKDVRFRSGVLNSLIRALAPDHVDCALLLLGFIRTMKLRVQRETLVVLIGACAKHSLIEEAYSLYRELRREGVGTTRESGSHLIMALCEAGQTSHALKVYGDMVVAERGSSTGARDRPAASLRQAETECSSLDGLREDASRGSTGPEELTAAELLGLRRSVLWQSGNELSSSETTERSARNPSRQTRLSRRRRQAVFPHARAMAALVQAVASEGNLDTAITLYRQLRRDSVGAAAVTLSNRYMWQTLIEAACRRKQLSLALRVFDDWKAYCATQTAMHRFDEDAQDFVPRISNGTLAFLEACCRADPEHGWRVYDVCAAMRQQAERRLQAALPRPRKKSHHFAEAAE